MDRVIEYDVVLMQRDMAAKGWEATDLATAAGVNKSTVSRFFSGDVQTAPTAKKLAKALGRALKHYILEPPSRSGPAVEARL